MPVLQLGMVRMASQPSMGTSSNGLPVRHASVPASATP